MSDANDALNDFLSAMTPTKADEALGMTHGTVRAAIERGEIEFLRLPNGKHMKVTPTALAAWVSDYCTHNKMEVA